MKKKVVYIYFVEIVIGEKTYELKICATCHIIRPHRSFHCSGCDNCVDEHGSFHNINIDHHCPYLNNCIGIRNHRSFTFFLFLTCNYLAFTMGCSIYRLASQPGKLDVIMSSICVIGNFFLIYKPADMMHWDFTYIMQGTTTNEAVREKWKDGTNPYDLGAPKNWKKFLCRSTPPSNLGYKTNINETKE